MDMPGIFHKDQFRSRVERRRILQVQIWKFMRFNLGLTFWPEGGHVNDNQTFTLKLFCYSLEVTEKYISQYQ